MTPQAVKNKDWTGNSVACLKTNGFANNSLQERHSDDYYATEPRAIEELLEREVFNNVWECACGEGHLAEVLKQKGLLGKATDVVDRGYGNQQDFLLGDDPHSGDIITNPPYRFAEQFIRQSLKNINDGNKVAMFLPIRYLEGKSRKTMFQEIPPIRVYVFSYRVKCAINGEFEKMKGSAVSYAWYVWEKGFAGKPTIDWI